MPALLMAVWFLGAPAPVGAGSVPAHPGFAASWSGEESPPGALRALVERRGGLVDGEDECAALVEEICRRSSPELCERVRHEAEVRPATEEDQRACRALLDDPARLSRLVRGVPAR